MPQPARPLSQAVSDGKLWSEYEIEATVSLTDRALRNLKFADAFAVLDSYGDIGTLTGTAEGLFYRDTRFLSRFELRLEGRRPLLLSSAVHEDKAALSVELTNPDLQLGQDRLLRASRLQSTHGLAISAQHSDGKQAAQGIYDAFGAASKNLPPP